MKPESDNEEMVEMTTSVTNNSNNSNNNSTSNLNTPITETPILNRPASTLSSTSGKAVELDPETISQLESPIVAGPVAEEDNDDDDDESAGYEESAERDEIIRERINRTQEQMRVIVDNLSDEQLKRYERFRRVGLARPTMEKLMQKILDQRVNTTSVIVTAGIAKVFVGELVEGARVVMEEEIRAQLELSLMDPDELEEAVITAMENRPLEPFHIIESHRRMKHENFTAPPSLLYSKPSPF